MLAICLAMLETERDQRRFTRLYEAYEKKIYAVALRLLGDQPRAEDAAQQTWLQLLRRTTAFPEDWDPPAREERQDEYDYLVSLIRTLPEGYRRVLELKCVEEWSNREIARRLGIKESTVAVRILRGRAMLKERLEKEGYTYAAV